MKKRTIPALAIAGTLALGIGGLAVAQHGHGDRSEARAERMAALDTNENGQIERAEIEAKRAADFALADTNGDGGLSPEEIEAHREAKRAERQARRFAKQDINDDGLIGIDEFNSRHLDRFDRMDTDDNGVISEEEREAGREGRRGHHKHGHNRG